MNPPPDAIRVPWQQRPEVVGALLVGALALLVSLARTLNEPARPTDFDQWFVAARAMLQGRSPFDAVGPTGELQWGWSLNYPLPAVLFTLPFTLLPVAVARVCFSAMGGALLGYALGRDRFRRLGLVLSAAFLIAVSRNQWSPFITAAWFVPLAAIFLAAKPNLAVPFVASLQNWRQFRWIAGIGVIVAVASLIARPAWPLEWFGVLRHMEYIHSPVMRPYGFLYALALFKWRRADARLFLALVCVPQTPSLYDLLPLFIVTRNLREVSLLSLLTHGLFLSIVVLGPFPAFNDYAYRLGYLATFLVYFPVMVMLLFRPNVSHEIPEITSAAPPRGLKAALEAMPRLDAVLLLINAGASALLLWLTLATPRA